MQAHSLSPQDSEITQVAPSPKRLKIFIIGDGTSTVSLLAYVLKQQGYQVCYFIRGANLATCIHSFQPDLVLLNSCLPSVNDFEDSLWSDTSQVFDIRHTQALIPFVSSIRMAGYQALGLSIGAVNDASNPFTLQKLLGRIRVVVTQLMGDEN